MDGLKVVSNLFEFQGGAPYFGLTNGENPYIKVMEYKTEGDFLEEITVVYVVDVQRYIDEGESETVERVFSTPFPNCLKNIMNTIRAIEKKSPLMITVS